LADYCPGLSSEELVKVVLEAVGCHGPFEWTIFSDGTPGGINHDSGSAAVVTRGSLDQPERVEVRRRRGRVVASSYEAEVEGVKLAVSWIRDTGHNCQGPVLICTDCRAITVGLMPSTEPGDAETRELRGLLDELQVPVLVQWVPGHAGLRGNDWAHEEARAATTGRKVVGEERKGVSLSSAKARIRRTVQDPPIAHERTKAVYQGTRGNEGGFTRKEAVLLAQLRSGHCLRLAAYKKVIDDAADPMCPLCGREPENLQHWLQQCPASVDRRVAEFGVASPPLKVLFQDPVAVLAFSRGSWAV